MEKREVFPLIDMIKESVLRAVKIVKNILSFARKSETSREKANLAEIIDTCLFLASSDFDLKKNYDFKKIEIIKKYEPAYFEIHCDTGSFQQVILNILKNGAEAMQEMDHPPRYVISYRSIMLESRSYVQIEIEDNGPGMSRKRSKKESLSLFLQPNRLDWGQGPGLSVSYFIITENMQGELLVDSLPGRGTRFIIRLPSD